MSRKLIRIIISIHLLAAFSLAESNTHITVVDNVNHVRLFLEFIEKDSCVLLSISEVAKIFRSSIAWNPIIKKITLRKGKESIVFDIGSPKVLINGKIEEMYPPAELITGRVYIPLKFILQEFSQAFDVQISWNNDNRKLTISPSESTSPVALNNRVSSTLEQGREYLRDLSTTRAETKAEISSLKQESHEPGGSPSSGTNKKILPEQFKIKTIVIDPGHGGKDSGAIGQRGLLEKDVVLEMTLQLREALQQAVPDVKILLTREGDYFIPLRERTGFANYKKADLFICLHSNAAFSRTASGFEVFFLSPDASDNESRALAAAENEVLKLENKDSLKKGINPAELILGGLAQEEFINESIELAGLIQENVIRRIGIEDRGIKSAFFWVLKDAMMPAVLIENGFISNPLEESRLKSREFRKEIVEAICQAIVDYKTSYEEQLKSD